MFNRSVEAFSRAHQLDPNLLRASAWLIGTRLFTGDSPPVLRRPKNSRRSGRTVRRSIFSSHRPCGPREPSSKRRRNARRLTALIPTSRPTATFCTSKLAIWPGHAKRSIGPQATSRFHARTDSPPGRQGRGGLAPIEAVPAGKLYDLMNDCLPDSSSAKCDVAVKKSQESFLSIPDANAWYFGAAMFAFLGKDAPAGAAAGRRLGPQFLHLSQYRSRPTVRSHPAERRFQSGTSEGRSMPAEVRLNR